MEILTYLVTTLGGEARTERARLSLLALAACAAAHRAARRMDVNNAEGSAWALAMGDLSSKTRDAQDAAARIAAGELTAIGWTGERGAAILARAEAAP